jgi:uncharacterized pyridoxal phosphate-containing UPF0001 family protein
MGETLNIMTLGGLALAVGILVDDATVGHDLDTLSMGMSQDLEAAILEGSTLVRIGTALFGPRPAART